LTFNFVRCLTGASPFGSVGRGGEPPDFLVDCDSGTVAVDCVVLADHHRRMGYRLMEHLRGRLSNAAGGRDFSGIQGCILSFWFGPGLDDLPPKRWDDTLVDPLLDAMADCHVDRELVAKVQAEIAERGFPQTMPPILGTGKVPDGAAGFDANVMLHAPQTLDIARASVSISNLRFRLARHLAISTWASIGSWRPTTRPAFSTCS
jgi:hypothetical protein